MTINQFIACYEPTCGGAKWLHGQRSLRRAWQSCPRPDWMLWALQKLDYADERVLRLYGCWCVRHTPLADGRVMWDLLTDERSRRVVEVAEAYVEGRATKKELDAAWAAAWAIRMAEDAAEATAWAARVAGATRDAAGDAAWAAAGAAGAAAGAAGAAGAARDAARLAQADHLREVVPWPTVAALLQEVKA